MTQPRSCCACACVSRNNSALPAGLAAGARRGSLRLVRAVRIDVQLDLGHAMLRLAMASPRVPAPLAQLALAHASDIEALPLAAGRQAAARATGELERQHALAARGMAEDDRAECAGVAL